MSIDRLQDRIRKTKNPSVIDLTVSKKILPPCVLEQADSWQKAYLAYMQELMEAFRGLVPALRFRFNGFAIYGAEGLELLKTITKRAKRLGFYILLDAPEALSRSEAELTAQMLFSEDGPAVFDGLLLSSYIGSDGIKPYAQLLKENEKSLFVVIRTPNKSAPEVQDLLAGSRLVHMVMAEKVNTMTGGLTGKCGYSQLGCAAAATSADSLKTLRSKYKNMFLFVDGYDYTTANAKYCSSAFDPLGHGAVICAGQGITGAWIDSDCCEDMYLSLAVDAAERMKKNLTKYVTIL